MKLTNYNPIFLVTQLNQPEYHDVNLVCDDGSFTASRLVLAAASPFLGSILSQEEEENHITFVGYKNRTVKFLVEFIVSGQCLFDDQQDLNVLKELVKHLGIRYEGHEIKVEDHEDLEVDPDPLINVDLFRDVFDYMQETYSDERHAEHEKPKKKPFLYTYQCTECKEVISGGKWKLAVHMTIHMGPRATECKVCGDQMGSRQAFREHKEKHNCDIEVFESVRCSKKSKRVSHCPHCNKRVNGEWPMINHLTVHIGDEARKCKGCDKILTTGKQWYDHKKLHKTTGEVCYICGKVFARKPSLKIHIENMHNQKAPSFECDLCGKRFKTKYSLQLHQRVHETARNFICDVCGFASKDIQCLKSHKLTHLKDRPFKCQYCDKSFNFKFWRDSHMATHLGVRSFRCSHCSKSFFTKRTLQGHVNTVHGSERLGCGICNATFKQMNDMKRHLITHTDLKPYCCTECGDRFNHGEPARRHFKALHPDKKVKIKFENSSILDDLKDRMVKKITVEQAA